MADYINMKKLIFLIFLTILIYCKSIIALDLAYPGVCNKVKPYSELLETLTSEVPEELTELSTTCAAAAGALAIAVQVAFDTAFDAALEDPATAPFAEGIAAGIAEGVLAAGSAEAVEPCADAAVEFEAFVDEFEVTVDLATSLVVCSAEYKPITALVITGTVKYPLCTTQISSMALRIGAMEVFHGVGVVADMFASLGMSEIYAKVMEHSGLISGEIDSLEGETNTLEGLTDTVPAAISSEIAAELAGPAEQFAPEIEAIFNAVIDAPIAQLSASLDIIITDITSLATSEEPVLIPQLVGAICKRYIPLCKDIILETCIQ